MSDTTDRFTGTYFQTLDEKSRLAMPVRFASVLTARTRRELDRVDPNCPDPETLSVVVSLSPNGRIGVYPRNVYEKVINDIREGKYPRLADIDPDILICDFENAREDIQLDKQNRFRIQQVLLDALSFRKEVAVVGSGEFVELLPKEECVESVSSRLRDLQRRRLGTTAREDNRE